MQTPSKISVNHHIQNSSKDVAQTGSAQEIVQTLDAIQGVIDSDDLVTVDIQSREDLEAIRAYCPQAGAVHTKDGLVYCYPYDQCGNYHCVLQIG